MKLKKRLIIIICISVFVIGALISIVILSYNGDAGNAALSSGLTYLVCDKPNSPLTGYDKIVYDYVSVAAYDFKSPASVRVISGSYIDDGEEIDLYLRISAMNGFGATTTGYYHISDGGNWCFDLEDDDYMDMAIRLGIEDAIYLDILRCGETDVFDIDLINKMLSKNWE